MTGLLFVSISSFLYTVPTGAVVSAGKSVQSITVFSCLSVFVASRPFSSVHHGYNLSLAVAGSLSLIRDTVISWADGGQW